LLNVFEAQQHLIFGQRFRSAAKTMSLQFLDDLRSRSFCIRSSSSIAFSVWRSSGSASLGITKSDHIWRHFATISMRLIHFAAGINYHPAASAYPSGEYRRVAEPALFNGDGTILRTLACQTPRRG
jgi:hypothetical protein